MRSIYCGCKFITRGLVINLANNNNLIFREEDFNFLYYLQEINYYLFLNNLNVYGSRIIFPNLRIIRGKAAFYLNHKHRITLRASNVNASELLFPRLTEITRGGVHIYGNPQLIPNLRGVLWNDIINQTQFVVVINNYENPWAMGEYILESSHYDCITIVVGTFSSFFEHLQKKRWQE